jgi:tetratricopeptide (TPR) repeat protein
MISRRIEEGIVAAVKKKTRKELLKEPDEFLTFSSRLVSFISQHKNEIFYAVVGLLGIAAVLSGYVLYSNRQEARAASLIGEAIAKYDRLKAGNTQEKAFQVVSSDFDTILSDYGNSANGTIARVIYANLSYEAGDFRKAADLYQSSLAAFADNPLIHFQILKSLGYTFGELKDYATAVSYFEQALATNENSLKDDVLFQLGELYSRMGNSEKSKEAFIRLFNDHKDSVYANMARERGNS